MHGRLAFAVALAASACGGNIDDSIKLASVTPAYGSLLGGQHVIIKGQGFLRDGAPPNHVLFGNNEAPLASASDDGTLDVEIPPGDKPGDVPVLVFNRNGTQIATGLFHYSTGPAITAVNPGQVLYNSTNTTITVTGSGFMDEGAGVTTVTVDGSPAVDVQVASDTSLSFTSLVGPPLNQPSITITNSRGTTTKDHAYQYIPANNPVLVMFAKSVPSLYAVIYDPVANQVIPIANRSSNTTVPPIGIRAVVRDANGDFWGVQRDNQFGKIDFNQQALINPVTAQGRIDALVRMGSTVYATDRNSGGFGTFDLMSGSFTQLATGMPQQGWALAASTAGLFIGYGTQTCCPEVQSSSTIGQINTTTGVISGTVNMSAPKHIGELRFIGTTLYGIDGRSGDIFTIDTTAGTTTVVKSTGIRIGGLEVFAPGAVQ